MPNPVTNPTPESLVSVIKDRLRENERSTAWLAKKIGIPDSTLRFQLDERPDRLTVKNWLAIASVLGMSREDVAA
jgi:hypothetical protein